MSGTQQSNLSDLVLRALSALHSSDANQRIEAVNFLEQLRKGDAHALLLVSATLTMHPSEEVLLAGFTLLTDLVRSRWSELTEEERGQVTGIAYKDVAEVCKAGKAAWAIKSKVAVLLAAVVRQQGTTSYAQLLPQLLSNADNNTLQAELACMVLHFISEDLTQFDQTQGEAKRQFLAALTSSVNEVFPFLCRMLEQHYFAATDSRAKGNSEDFGAHSAVIAASLSALSTWVDWTPMPRITASNVIDACTFFLDSSEFRLQALDVLKQIVTRKRTSERHEDYDALMDKAAALLLADCQKQGFLSPGGTMPPAVAAELDVEGQLEEFGQRLCAVLVSLGEGHFKCLAQGERRSVYLQQMLAFSRHRNIHLSVLVLPLWMQLLREALPNISGGAAVSPATAAAAAAAATSRRTPDGLQVVTGPISVAASSTAPTPAGTIIRPPSITFPPELSHALMSVLAEQLPRVILPADESVSDFPIHFDSHAEYKEFCSGYKGSVKQIIRMATHLVPEQGLAIAAAVLSACLSPPDAAAAAKVKTTERARQLEAAVITVEAAVPALTELAAQLPAASEGLATLLQQLMLTRVPDPLTMTPLLARTYESFSRFLLLRSDLAAPLVSACLSAMMCIPLEEAGHLPPPARLTTLWKRQAEGRLSMCAAVVTLAKAAPSAFIPYLEPLVSEVQKLWGQGLLREGERVLLWEGLLAASVAASPDMQAQILGYILAPLAAQWSDPHWQQSIASSLAFVAAYLPVQEVLPGAAAAAADAAAGGSGAWALGARAQRWTLYHQTTLVERAFRRTLAGPQHLSYGSGEPGDASGSPLPSPTGAAGGRQQAGGAPSAPSPICNHLGWSLPVVAQLLRCLHGIWEPGTQAALGPLGKLVTGMDPVERAMRLGEDRDTVKEKEEPRCVAGSSLADARYFVRGVREACHMILSLAATYCGASLWSSAQLSASLVPTLSSDLAWLDYQQLRMLHRHVFHAWAVHCPAELQQQWVLPICKVVLPCMSARLARDWAASVGGGEGAGQAQAVAPGQGPGQAGDGGSRVSEEVLTDALLRECTREHMALLLLLTRPPGAPDPATLPKAPRPSNGTSGAPPAPGSAQAPGIGGERSASQQQLGAEGAGSGEPVLYMLLRLDPSVAEAAMRTAVMGLCWPDADSAAKAAGVCRYFVNLATNMPVLEPFVCSDMLKTACVSLAQVFAVDIQADVLALIRAIIVTFMPRNPIVRRSLQQLLQVPDSVIEGFEKQLAVIGSDSKQRNLIRQLVAQAGNEEVKKVLSSVVRVEPILAPAKPVAKPSKKADTDQDQLLGGAIFNMIFQSHS